MKSETKICQNCKQKFVIDSEDFGFYEKIKVPPPTFCSECRFQRRLVIRNERNLYRRECGLCKKIIISMYPKGSVFPVYCHDCWWGDEWDPIELGTDYNFQKPFFLQFQELFNKIPKADLIVTNNKNCNYCNYVGDSKECYLCFGSILIENCLYGSPYKSKDCVDTYLVRECEYCYGCIDCEKLSHSVFTQECSSSIDLTYCFDCKNCQNCIGCVGLRNKNYYIFNKSYTREEYIEKRNQLLAVGLIGLEGIEKKFKELKLKFPHRFSITIQCVDVSGDHIIQSKNAKNVFEAKNSRDIKFCTRTEDSQNVYDMSYCEVAELCYEYSAGYKVNGMLFSMASTVSNNIFYSDSCFSNCSNCFACIGLRNKSYCILNKQYTKEEYEELVPKIIKHMNDMPYISSKKNPSTGSGQVYKYGEFFPPELSPFCYNETIAQEYFPLTKEQVLEQGYKWKDREKRNYEINIYNKDIPDNIKDVNDEIINKVIECEHKGECNEQCTEAFKIIENELQFYKRMNLPLPRLCPNCRHYQRLKQRNPLKLWHRTCMCDKTNHHNHKGKCDVEFETSYAPDRPEIVYCERCYQQEVY